MSSSLDETRGAMPLAMCSSEILPVDRIVGVVVIVGSPARHRVDAEKPPAGPFIQRGPTVRDLRSRSNPLQLPGSWSELVPANGRCHLQYRPGGFLMNPLSRLCYRSSFP